MGFPSKFFDKDWKTSLLVFIISSFIFSYYFSDAFLHLNSRLTSTEGDGMKNYYTFIYHTVRDKSLFTFSGLNYPYTEQCVYTDCQPGLTYIFKLLPFTHEYLVGILHFLMLFSYIIAPNILFKIFRLYNVSRVTSFFSAIAIGLIPPQLDRIGGHFGLSYGCAIPLVIYLVNKYTFASKISTAIWLLILNCFFFLLHPYLGLGCSLFTFFSFFIFSCRRKQFFTGLKRFIPAFICGVGPIIFFKTYMFLTDTHSNRPEEPFGVDVCISNPASIFVPTFGPFQHFLSQIIKVGHREWEGLSYIGIFPFFMLFLFVVLFPFFREKMQLNKIMAALFISSILLLLFSFGLHNHLLNALNIHSYSLRQFRALGRFAWFFYYMVPIFTVISLSRLIENKFTGTMRYALLLLLPLLFIIFNGIEGNDYLKGRSTNYLKGPNPFVEEYLTSSEKEMIESVSSAGCQAILPVPFYCVGSELYDRDGTESAYLTMLLSYHCNLPAFGGLLARTSVIEAKSVMELLNEYKKNHPVLNLLNNKPILVLKAAKARKPNENRLIKKLKLFKKTGETELYLASKKDFMFNPSQNQINIKLDLPETDKFIDSSDVFFARNLSRPPFSQTNIINYEHAFEFDKNKYKSGEYVLSFYYHFVEETINGINCNLIVTKTNEKESIWEVIKPMRQASGYYAHYLIFEQNLTIDGNSKYEFLLQGPSDKTYHISHLLFRSEEKNVEMKEKDGTILYNNFPLEQ
ncbi:MAG: hypothetical protein ACXVNQ_08135 [Bacteroidia bacterium]